MTTTKMKTTKSRGEYAKGVELGQRIAERRKLYGWSQEQLAYHADISQAYLSQLETGVVRDPGIYLTGKLAKVLGFTLAQLTGEEVNGTSDQRRV